MATRPYEAKYVTGDVQPVTVHQPLTHATTFQLRLLSTTTTNQTECRLKLTMETRSRLKLTSIPNIFEEELAELLSCRSPTSSTIIIVHFLQTH